MVLLNESAQGLHKRLITVKVCGLIGSHPSVSHSNIYLFISQYSNSSQTVHFKHLLFFALNFPTSIAIWYYVTYLWFVICGTQKRIVASTARHKAYWIQCSNGNQNYFYSSKWLCCYVSLCDTFAGSTYILCAFYI